MEGSDYKQELRIHCQLLFKVSVDAAHRPGPTGKSSTEQFKISPRAVGAYGHEVDYGTGGYVVYFPNPRFANSSTVAQKLISDLKSDDFIDRATRAIIVDFNLYNPGTKLLTAARLVSTCLYIIVLHVYSMLTPAIAIGIAIGIAIEITIEIAIAITIAIAIATITIITTSRFVIQQFNSGAYQVACKLRTMRMSLYDYSSASVRLRVACEILFVFALLHRYYVWGHEVWVHRTRIKDLVSS